MFKIVLFYIYILFFILLFITFKPTIITNFILFLYIYFTTNYIIKSGYCEKRFATLLWEGGAIGYSFLCILIYNFVHCFYKKYKKHWYLLIAAPLVYYLFVIIIVNHYGCEKDFNFKAWVKRLRDGSNEIEKRL